MLRICGNPLARLPSVLLIIYMMDVLNNPNRKFWRIHQIFIYRAAEQQWHQATIPEIQMGLDDPGGS